MLVRAASDVKRASGKRFAIIASSWNGEVVGGLIDGAEKAFREAQVERSDIFVLSVPGSFEIPLACKLIAESGSVDGIVALGVLIRGATEHFRLVAEAAMNGITSVMLETRVPVCSGIIAADCLEDALARAGENSSNRGYESAKAAIDMVLLLPTLRSNRHGAPTK